MPSLREPLLWLEKNGNFRLNFAVFNCFEMDLNSRVLNHGEAVYGIRATRGMSSPPTAVYSKKLRAEICTELFIGLGWLWINRALPG